MSKAWRNLDIRIYAVAASLLLSLWHSLSHQLPNPDAFTYVRTAQIFLDQGIGAAFSWYPNATYPTAMGILHIILGVDLFTAGAIINGAFFALLTYAFITLVKEIDTSQTIGLFAAFTILGFSELNEYRYFLIRDAGFLALLFCALLHLTRCYKSFAFKNAIFFCLFCFAAALFRAEALVFYALSPVVLLFNPNTNLGQRMSAFGKVQALNLAIGVIGILTLSLVGFDFVSNLQNAAAIYAPYLDQLAQYFGAENRELTTVVFGKYASNHSSQDIGLFLVSGMVGLLIKKILVGLNIAALFILILGISQRSIKLPATLRPAIFFAALAFGIMLGFLILTRFLSGRYTLSFCLLVLLLVPSVLDNAWTIATKSRKSKLWRSALVALALFCFVDSHFNTIESSVNANATSEWLRENTSLQALVLTNDTYVAYHSERVSDYDRVSRYLEADTIANSTIDTFIAFRVDRRIEVFTRVALDNKQIVELEQFPEQGEPEYIIYRRL